MRWPGRAGVVSAGPALAAGSAAVPALAAPSAHSAAPAAARATAGPAPAPTVLSHTYDADTRTVTRLGSQEPDGHGHPVRRHRRVQRR